jgi:hypothetical protein
VRLGFSFRQGISNELSLDGVNASRQLTYLGFCKPVKL